MTIAGIELSGFLATDTGSDHVSGVHFLYTGPSINDTFNVLKRSLVDTYGVPSKELTTTAGPVYFWRFESGSVTLILFAPHENLKGGVSLAYMKSLLGPPILH